MKTMPIIGSNKVLSMDDLNVLDVAFKFGKTHKIEAVAGTKVVMSKLKNNQSVVFGDGATYHFRLTKI